MTTVLNGIYCSLPNGYGLQLDCEGPACSSIANLTILQCNTTSNGLSCAARSGSCDGVNSNFTDTFTLRDDSGSLSSYDLISVNGKQSTLTSNYSLNGTDITDASTTPSSTTNNSASSSTSASPQSTASKSSASRQAKQLSAPLYFFALWLFALFVLPGVSASYTPASPPTPTPPLALEETSNLTLISSDLSLSPRADAEKIIRLLFKFPDVSEALLKSSMDLLAVEAKAQGHPIDVGTAVPLLFNTLRNEFLPTGVNAITETITGHPEEAAKDLVKFAVEQVLEKAIIAAAGETFGLSLLLLLVSHVAVDMAVDELFKGGHVLVEFTESAVEGHGANMTSGGAGAGEACDSGNFSASPWFFRDNQFGTDEWRDCVSCCVAWQEGTDQVGCGCCVFDFQYADPSLRCCSKDYYHQCCRVDCGIVES